MPVQFKMPDLGEGVHEGEVLKWLVRAGDPIREDQSLVEVMTDKVTAEIPSPYEGTVLELLVDEGAVVPVGTPLVAIDTGDGVEPDGDGATGRNGDGTALRQEPSARSQEPGAASRVRAVPFVRNLARDLGIDLETIAGTGPAGRITEADVRAAAGPAAPERAPSRPSVDRPAAAIERPSRRVPSTEPGTGHRAPGTEERIPFRGLRRRIADHMVQALRSSASCTYVDEVDLTELVALREKAREMTERQGVKLTYLPFVMKAVTAALREHPRLNAVIDEERGEIVLKKEYHLGFACETPEGLVVPVVRDVDRKSILDLAREIADLAERARDGKLDRSELQGGTFSVTSMGPLGGLLATPILNHPEVAILGVHKIVRRPVYQGDAIVPREIACLSLTFDHRALDGTDAARFVASVIRPLEDPNLLLLS
jgi:pyruvate dehydrogenase E2 component (dihydrolipoamide acetyltransferase)